MVYTNFPNEYSGTEQGVFFNGRAIGGAVDLSAQQDVSPLNPVGCVTRYQGNLYRYVYLSAGTTVAGAPAYWLTTAQPSNGLFSVTATNGATGADNCFAGIFLAAAITAARYIWIQVGGVNNALACSSGAVIGERLVATASDTLSRVADGVSGPNLAVAVCTVAENGSNVAGGIILGPFGF